MDRKDIHTSRTRRRAQREIRSRDADYVQRAEEKIEQDMVQQRKRVCQAAWNRQRESAHTVADDPRSSVDAPAAVAVAVAGRCRGPELAAPAVDPAQGEPAVHMAVAAAAWGIPTDTADIFPVGRQSVATAVRGSMHVLFESRDLSNCTHEELLMASQSWR